MAKKNKEEAVIDETPEIEIISDAPINATEEPVIEEVPAEEPKKEEPEVPERRVYVDEAKQI